MRGVQTAMLSATPTLDTRFKMPKAVEDDLTPITVRLAFPAEVNHQVLSVKREDFEKVVQFDLLVCPETREFFFIEQVYEPSELCVKRAWGVSPAAAMEKGTELFIVGTAVNGKYPKLLRG